MGTLPPRYCAFCSKPKQGVTNIRLRRPWMYVSKWEIKSRPCCEDCRARLTKTGVKFKET